MFLKDIAVAISSFDHLKTFSFGFKIRSICVGENILITFLKTVFQTDVLVVSGH